VDGDVDPPVAPAKDGKVDDNESEETLSEERTVTPVLDPGPDNSVAQAPPPLEVEWEKSPPPTANLSIPAQYGADAEIMREYSQTLIKRIASLINYKKESTNTYAAGLVPDYEWGINKPLDDKSGILCKPSSNEPLSFWIVGKISRLWFFNANGERASQVAINVIPLSGSVGNKCRKLLADVSFPVTESIQDGYGDLRATRWQNSRVYGSAGSEIHEFLNVFDATQVYSAKHDMPRCKVDKLGLRDLVLVEVNVARYKLKDGEEQAESSSTQKKRYAPTPWLKWRAHYELCAISLLHKTRFPNGMSASTTDDDDDDKF